jgi:S-formylglutathione hydrolase FrmB
MIYLQTHVRSRALNKNVQLNILLPQNPSGEYKTLWLLHGNTDDHTAWMRNSSIERYAEKLGIAVVMPNAERGWYTDSAYGAKHFTFISEELPAILRAHLKGMSDKREDNVVAGLSMGGYGAMKLALKRPEKYGACISLSGAFDITRKNRPVNLDEWRSIFGFDIESPDVLACGEHDLFAIASSLAESGATPPEIRFWCGTEDRLIAVNDSFHEHLNALNLPHTYEFSEGDHSWKWWDKHIERELEALLGKE